MRPEEEPTPTPATPATKTVTINLVAKSIGFDTNRIVVPAGAEVVIEFDNQDGVAHNFSAFKTSLSVDPIFVGEIITGPAKTTYTFRAPTEPGTYRFQCDPHFQIMNGEFVVQPPSV